MNRRDRINMLLLCNSQEIGAHISGSGSAGVMLCNLET